MVALFIFGFLLFVFTKKKLILEDTDITDENNINIYFKFFSIAVYNYFF